VPRYRCTTTPASPRYTPSRVEGANINFDEHGQFHSILDTTSIRYLAEQLAEAQGVGPINYLGGGAVGYMAQKT